MLLILMLILPLRVAADVLSADKNCSCGFYDPNTKELFTDSLIVYFNETSTLPNDFVAEDYQHEYEKDWNAIYRQGADPSNLEVNQTDTLELYVSPPTKTHLVNGAGIRTARRDIYHGSFRTLMKSPQKLSGGSAQSMMWQYNETETAQLSLMNTNTASQAWVGTFINDEFTARELGVNYSTAFDQLQTMDNNHTSVLKPSAGVDLWEYTEYRIDWTEDYINFYIDGYLARSVSHKENSAMPSVPAPLFFKHWSTGNMFSMAGPPQNRSVANIAWIRMFFNSSSMSEDALTDFNARCLITLACSTDDNSLRGSTPYLELATQVWKQAGGKNVKRMPALWISVICISMSSFLLLHAFIRREPWRKRPHHNAHGNAPAIAPTNPEITIALITNEPTSSESSDSRPPSLNTTSWSSFRFVTADDSSESKDDLAIKQAAPSPAPSLGTSAWGGSTHGSPSRAGSVGFDSRGTTPRVLSPDASNFNTTREDLQPPPRNPARGQSDGKPLSQYPSEQTIAVMASPDPEDKVQMSTVTESALPPPRMKAQPLPPRERVDYLAGLVAMCAILVTVMHFGLTFVPAMVIPGAPAHYKSEAWAAMLVAPFILNQMWLGVFFTTSVRFLVAGYLKRGDMHHIAKAAVRRTPRLMIPVASIAMLEYFFIDCGATKYLRYIPSITWSTWPYVTRFPTVGHFISEVLELIYIIPNAIPQITYHYCTGVLWTIAVQLQGTWLVLCGVIVVHEIRSPWKRMAYYAFCVLNHWYAQSWGSYLWLGLLLTDLDVTYKYKPYLHARPFAYYPLISILWLCVAAGFLANMIPPWTGFNFATFEHNIHPDAITAEPISHTSNAGYPAYYVPRLNGLLFAAGMQAIVELSPVVQWVLSLPPLLVLFPHIFTIYLLHGLVFWSWGTWLMIFLADRGFGYGINVTVVGITCYVVLFACLPIVTPVVEALGKDITSLVWMDATEKSPPRRRTLFPFPEDLFKKRDIKVDVEAGARSSLSVVGSSGRSTPSEKGKVKEKIKEVGTLDYNIKPVDGRNQVPSGWI